MNNEPLGYFITFTVYGTFLQGDSRWWHSRENGIRAPQPLLKAWHQKRLRHAVLLLTDEQRTAIKQEIDRFCEYRNWRLWKANPRSNHVHVVVTAPGYIGKTVRDQIKANCTRILRERWSQFCNRPVWTVGGAWSALETEQELENAILYAGEVQDRKGRDLPKPHPR
jgi:REP element-mobilizing transposase RayT